MPLTGLDAATAEALIGIDTLWGGDVMNPSGTGRFIADCWFSDEPLPAAYTHPSAGALRANGGVGVKTPDKASLEAYVAAVDVKGAISRVISGSRGLGGIRGAYLEGLGLCSEVMWDLGMEILGQGPEVPYDRCVQTITGAPPGPSSPSEKRQRVADLLKAAGHASERAVAIAPQRWESQWARGVYYDEIARDHKKALAAQLEATRLGPENAEAWDGLSLAQGYNGNWAEARASAERALVDDPRSVQSLQRASDAYMALGEYDEALNKLALAKSIAPMDPRPVFRLMLVRLADVNREGSRAEMRESPALKADINLFVGGNFVPFMLDQALQDRLIVMKPGAFVEGRGAWAGTLAQLFSLRGNFVRARAYADSARMSYEGMRRDAMNDYRIDRGLAQAYSILNQHDATLAAGARSLAKLPNKGDRSRAHGINTWWRGPTWQLVRRRKRCASSTTSWRQGTSPCTVSQMI